jgi:hypothetical protein
VTRETGFKPLLFTNATCTAGRYAEVTRYAEQQQQAAVPSAEQLAQVANVIASQLQEAEKGAAAGAGAAAAGAATAAAAAAAAAAAPLDAAANNTNADGGDADGGDAAAAAEGANSTTPAAAAAGVGIAEGVVAPGDAPPPPPTSLPPPDPPPVPPPTSDMPPVPPPPPTQAPATATKKLMVPRSIPTPKEVDMTNIIAKPTKSAKTTAAAAADAAAAKATAAAASTKGPGWRDAVGLYKLNAVGSAWFLGVSSVQSEGQSGAIAPSLDTSCTNLIVLLTLQPLLNLKCGSLASKFTFKSNVYRYSAAAAAIAEGGLLSQASAALVQKRLLRERQLAGEAPMVGALHVESR